MDVYTLTGKSGTGKSFHAMNLCKKYNIEFYVKRADVQKIANDKKIGTEEAGRKVRYAFFEEVLQKTGSNKIFWRRRL